MSNWRLETLFGEAPRNVAAGWPRTVLFGVVVAGLVGALTWSELATTDDILGFQRDYIAAGGNVLVASHPLGLVTDRCVSLQARSEVLASGASSTGDVTSTNIAPALTFQTLAVTSGALAVWDAGPGAEVALAEGMVVGSAVSDELGLVDGSYLALVGGRSVPVGVVDVERRSPQNQRSIMIALPPNGKTDTCWVEMQPGNLAAGEALLHAVYSDTGPEFAVRPWIRPGEFARDPITELANRPQTRAWLVAGVVLTLLIWLDLWFRHGALSLYRILGTTRSGLLFLAQTEILLVAVLATGLGFLWGAAVYGATEAANPVSDQYLVALRTVLSTLAIPLILGPLPVLLTGARGGLLNQLKDR
jgi:hypothetical protein